MTLQRDPERLIHDFVLEGAERLPDPVYDAIRAQIERRPQRVVIGPWRLPTASANAKFAAAAVAVIAIGALGLAVLRPGTSPGVGGRPTDSPSISSPPSAAPSASTAAPPALTNVFTSERYGFSMMYPAGWVPRPATEAWTTSVPDFGSTAGDIVHDPVLGSRLWIAVASQLIGESTPGEWAAEKMALDDGCPASEPIAVDGATGLLGAGNCTRAAVTTDGRGYFIRLYTSGDDISSVYDGAWFEELLATVQIRPEDVADLAPSGTP
jgi:hypothetical protein